MACTGTYIRILSLLLYSSFGIGTANGKPVSLSYTSQEARLFQYHMEHYLPNRPPAFVADPEPSSRAPNQLSTVLNGGE
jgi:hypothetical protein